MMSAMTTGVLLPGLLLVLVLPNELVTAMGRAEKETLSIALDDGRRLFPGHLHPADRIDSYFFLGFHLRRSGWRASLRNLIPIPRISRGDEVFAWRQPRMGDREKWRRRKGPGRLNFTTEGRPPFTSRSPRMSDRSIPPEAHPRRFSCDRDRVVPVGRKSEPKSYRRAIQPSHAWFRVVVEPQKPTQKPKQK